MKTSRSGPVVVGWDASPEARLALQYAHDRAGRMHQRLRVVIARGDIGRISEWADDWSRGLAGEWSEAARKELAELGWPDLEPDVREGTPVEVLLAEAELASCLVVGAGGHGPLSARLLGSVSQHLARHAACPVLVVRAGGDDAGPVVAGVDGSPASLRALEFAVQEGAARGAPVEVVHALPRPQARASLEGAAPPELRDELDVHEERVRARVEVVVGVHPGVAVSFRPTHRSAARELALASEHACLVVVGGRGDGGFVGLRLGSVANAVLHRSHCPVAVVH